MKAAVEWREVAVGYWGRNTSMMSQKKQEATQQTWRAVHLRELSPSIPLLMVRDRAGLYANTSSTQSRYTGYLLYTAVTE